MNNIIAYVFKVDCFVETFQEASTIKSYRAERGVEFLREFPKCSTLAIDICGLL